MELREKIADIIVGEIGPQDPNRVEVYAMADAILAIPELKAALEIAREVADGRR